jgi:hypothetical protein
VKIYLASAGVPASHSAIVGWQHAASQDRRRRHVLVDDADDADIVLFTECNQLGDDLRLAAIREAPITRRLRDRIYVYDQRDRPWCGFPGAYVSMPARSFDRRFQVASSYLPVPGFPVSESEYRTTEPDLLMSFIGSPTHPVRKKLFEAQHPRGLFTRVDGFLFSDSTSRDFATRRKRFEETLVRSKFVLCPRGHGTSSFRLYETLAAGRVPVIIADEWVAPTGPAWESCSIRWPERASVDQLFERLEELEPKAEEMGRCALEAFTEWFAAPVVFDRIASDLALLVAARAGTEFPARGVRGRRYQRLVAAQHAGRVRAAARRWRARR